MSAKIMQTKKSGISFGAQFSPNQVDLLRLLEIILDCAGNRLRITESIRDQFFTSHTEGQRWKLADNTVLSLRAYGLLEADGATPSILAKELSQLATDPVKLYERFAKHILLYLRGIDFIETIMMMQRANEAINLHTLNKRLEQRGIHVPRGVVHLSSMRLWLTKAGIFETSSSGGPGLYVVNFAPLNRLIGISIDAIDALTQLNAPQRAFLRALTRVGESSPLIANRIADLASAFYAVEYNHKELPKSILFPLRDLGYITIAKSTIGRGAKPYEVSLTEKFREEISEPILIAAAEKSGLVPRRLFEQPLPEVLADLKSSDHHVKGKALEILVIYLTRLLDLEFRGWRIRSSDTGGAEVDAIVEGARLIFSRWQIQAKNTSMVRLDDIAKEVGLSLTFIYSNVVMIVTTGDFTKDGYRYAQHVMKTCNLNVILLNGSDLNRVSRDATEIVTLLNNKAKQAMALKERADYFATQ